MRTWPEWLACQVWAEVGVVFQTFKPFQNGCHFQCTCPVHFCMPYLMLSFLPDIGQPPDAASLAHAPTLKGQWGSALAQPPHIFLSAINLQYKHARGYSITKGCEEDTKRAVRWHSRTPPRFMALGRKIHTVAILPPTLQPSSQIMVWVKCFTLMIGVII